MPECQYCGAELDDRYNFCLSCNHQVKCTNCGEMLVRDKRKCFVCGRPIVSETAVQGQSNEFILEENQTDNSAHRLIKGRFSDSAVEHAAVLLGSFTRSRPVAPHVPAHQQPALTPLGSAEEQVPEQTNELTGKQDQLNPQDTLTAQGQDGSDKSRALRHFKAHGENEVIPRLVDFKGKTWKEQQRRFMVLYVWAFNEILSHPVPSKDNVVEAAKKSSNIYDKNNTRKYLDAITNEYLLSTDQELELNPRGIQFVEEILAEIDDPSVDEGFPYWKGTTKPAAKRSTLSKKDEEEVNEWVDMSIDIGDFDVRTLSSGPEWAMFGLWSITKGLDVASAVKSPVVLQYLTKKYRTVPVNQNAFSMALSRNNNKFQKTTDGNYYLTPQAQREVESWIERGTVEGSEAQ